MRSIARDSTGSACIPARIAEHHAQKVLDVGERVLRVHEGLAHVVLVGHGGDGGHLGDEPVRRYLAVAGVIDVQRVVVESR
jgi:hypothetical protein